VKNFWYQLTIWVSRIKDLESARLTLEKYHEPYVVKRIIHRGKDKRFAVFTMGNNFTPAYRDEMLTLMNSYDYSKSEAVEC